MNNHSEEEVLIQYKNQIELLYALHKRFELFSHDENGTYYDIIYHNSKSRKDWVTWSWPKKKPMPNATNKVWAKYFSEKNPETFIKYILTSKDLSIGTTIKNRKSAKWLAIEADLFADDKTNEINESNYNNYLHTEIIDEFYKYGIYIYPMLTGNRSIHLHCFFQTNVSIEELTIIAEYLKGLFKNINYDCNNIQNKMRLPGSVHQKTGKNSYYIGTNQEIESITESINNLCVISNKKKNLLLSSINNKSKRVPINVCNTNQSIKTKALYNKDNTIITLDKIEKNNFRNSLLHEKGYAKLCALYNSKEKAHTFLLSIYKNGIEENDETTLTNRKQLLDSLWETHNFTPMITFIDNNKLLKKDINKIEKCINRLKRYQDKKNKSQFDLETIRAVATHIMTIVRNGKNQCCGTGEIATLINAPRIKAKRYMDLICDYKTHKSISPLFEMTKEAIRMTNTRQWKVKGE